MNSIAAAVPATSRLQSLQSLKTRRKLWLKVHLWLGLSLGLFLAMIGLTGSVLVFWHEIDTALNPALYQNATPPDRQKSLDEILDAAKHAAPPGWASSWTQIPTTSNENYVFSFYYPNTSPPPEQAQSITLGINPYTAEMTHKRVFYHGSNPLKHCLVGFFFKLHYALLLGETGATLVGILAVLFLISALSGLILWWPLTGQWRRVLTIKSKASIERFNHDLHQTAGFYSLVVLLAVVVSGIYFNLPDQFRWLVQRFSPLTPEAQVQAPPPTSTAMPTLETLLQQARLASPGGVSRNYDFSGGDSGLFSACFDDVPELRRHVVASRCLVFDRADGKLLQIRDAVHGSGGDLFMLWQWPLHSGQAFGWTGRILVFISGLICPLLFATGVIRWLQKRRAKQDLLARRDIPQCRP